MIANDTFGSGDTRVASIMIVAGSLALLIALVGLSAFQARVHPVLSWAAFALPAIGTLGLVLGASSTALGRGELTDAFYFGLLTFFVGSLLFAIATFFTAVFSRLTAVLLGAATLLAFAAGGGEDSRPILNIVSLICFTLGWVALGLQAIRLDRPVSEPNPA